MWKWSLFSSGFSSTAVVAFALHHALNPLHAQERAGEHRPLQQLLANYIPIDHDAKNQTDAILSPVMGNGHPESKKKQ